MARPRPEDCDRLTAAAVRQRVAPGTQSHRLADGTALQLRWRQVAGCWGGAPGRSLLMACPSCGSWRRVLHRPPGEGWACWGCRPLSTASHRRSGSRRGRGKPASWETARIEAAQTRTAALLGLEAWPPPGLPLLWQLEDLARLSCRPGGPRLSPERRMALLARLSALETLRLCVALPAVCDQLQALGGKVPAVGDRVAMAERARVTVKATGWAVRRPGGGQAGN